MEELRQHSGLRHPLISILITLLMFFIGFQLIGPALGGYLWLSFTDKTETEFWGDVANPIGKPEMRNAILVMQACGAFIGMIVMPYYFLRRQGRALRDYFSQPSVLPSLLVPVLVIVFMGVNAFFIKWNKGIQLPFGWDDWAQPMEEKLSGLTLYMTQFDSMAQALLAVLVIAVLPAIGEEIIFRGMIQNDFYRATRNIHLSIWISAAIFSAVHIQFYGFVPRMLLGAMFGYLYYWSGNLWMPTLAHFVNNGFTLLTLYLFNTGAIDIDIEKAEPSPLQVLISVVFSALLVYAYKNFYNKREKADIPD